MVNYLAKSSLLLCLFWGPAMSAISKRHTKVMYNAENGLTVRNANGNNDGQFSVNGPCGGNNNYGNNGVTAILSGTELTIKTNYGTGTNGDHASGSNQFRVAFVCGEDALSGNQDLLARASSTVQEAGVVAAPAGSRPEGYEVKVVIPQQLGDCVLSVLDQRNWGGCYDLFVAEQTEPQTVYVNREAYDSAVFIDTVATYLSIDPTRITILQEKVLGKGTMVEFEIAQEGGKSGNELSIAAASASPGDLGLDLMSEAEAREPIQPEEDPVDTPEPTIPGTGDGPDIDIPDTGSSGSGETPTGSDNSAMLIGIIVGGVAAVALVGFVGFFAYQRSRRNAPMSTASTTALNAGAHTPQYMNQNAGLNAGQCMQVPQTNGPMHPYGHQPNYGGYPNASQLVYGNAPIHY